MLDSGSLFYTIPHVNIPRDENDSGILLPSYLSIVKVPIS